jgi:hypothetical protein
MKKGILVTCCFSLLLVAGCYSEVKVPMLMSDGKTVAYASYKRFGNQNLENFKLDKEPNGVWKVSFDRQISETEMAFNMGLMQGKLGGKNQ